MISMKPEFAPLVEVNQELYDLVSKLPGYNNIPAGLITTSRAVTINGVEHPMKTFCLVAQKGKIPNFDVNTLRRALIYDIYTYQNDVDDLWVSRLSVTVEETECDIDGKVTPVYRARTRGCWIPREV